MSVKRKMYFTAGAMLMAGGGVGVLAGTAEIAESAFAEPEKTVYAQGTELSLDELGQAADEFYGTKPASHTEVNVVSETLGRVDENVKDLLLFAGGVALTAAGIALVSTSRRPPNLSAVLSATQINQPQL